jgi:Fic family protein
VLIKKLKIMPYKENLKRAKVLKEELDKLRPLSSEMEKRIMQKFRLDWNYHSSHIEGNSLTYGETKALLLFHQTAQAKPLKDHLEMSGHDEAIKNIEDVVKQKRPLTESFIRELHEIILKQPYEVDAITPDGNPTKKLVQIGKYKTTSNHVKTTTGEIFYFASPEETPSKMGELLTWYNENLNKTETDPVLFATEFHYRFIRIHPFDDGNGRIARLLMNFILMQKGYPPAIIKTEDKQNYFNALQQADVGQIEYFFNYICEQVNHSLELMIKGAKGENIEDPDDLDKKLALLRQKIEAEDDENDIKVLLSVTLIKNLLYEWAFILLEEISKKITKFNEFYYDPKHYLSIQFQNKGPIFEFIDKIPIDDISRSLNNQHEEPIDRAGIILRIGFGLYKKSAKHPFGCNYTFSIEFDRIHYEILTPYWDANAKGQIQKSYLKRLLHKPITQKEINEIASIIGNTLYQHIENALNNIH